VVVARLRALTTSVARPGEDLPGHLVSLFRSEGDRLANELRTAWREGRLDDARRYAHTLKGSARNVGATAAAEAAARAEAAVGAHAAHGNDVDVDVVDVVDVAVGDIVTAVAVAATALAAAFAAEEGAP
jgi:HPt (histidine-containing phosphotransfer) domain-containing protein